MGNLTKFKVFAVLFRYKHSGAVHQIKGGGNRLKTVGYDVGILHDLVGVGAHDDPAIPWFSLKFKLFYYPGGRTHGSGAAKGSSPSAPPFSSFGYGEKL